MAKDTIYVKIKTWDDMLQEYGSRSSDDTDIAVPNVFTSQMEQMMPYDRIIEVDLRPNKDSYLWHPKDCEDLFIISEEMIEQHCGTKYPHISTSIILPTKDTKISEFAFNHTSNAYYLPTGKNYLHSDMIIRTSTVPTETGYYPTEQSALFAKLRFERLQQKGLLHDFFKPTNYYYSITDSDITCSS